MAGIFGAPLAASNMGMDPRTLMAANEAARVMQQGMQAQQPQMMAPQQPMPQQMPPMQASMTQQDPNAMPPQMQTPQQYLAPKRTLSDKLGLLADAFMNTNQNTQMLMGRENQHRSEWQAQQNAMLQRAQEFADWQTKEQWKRANPEPAAPYRWRSNAGDLMEMGPDGQPRVAYDDPTDKTEWIRTVDPMTNEVVMTPMPMGGGRPATPSRPPVGATIADPRRAGGPASAPGGFQR